MDSNIQSKKMLNILKQVEVLTEMGWKDEAIEIANIEIENLQGLTPLKCKNRAEDKDYCKKCHNTNCEKNQKVVVGY